VRLLAAILAVGLVGCGGGQRDDADLGAVEVATEWVEALNDRDYRRACGLSIPLPQEVSCESELENGYGDVTLEPPEGAYFNRSEDQPAGGQFSAFRKGGGKPATFAVEERAGRYLVHFEVSVIR